MIHKLVRKRTYRSVEKGNRTYLLSPARQAPIWKGRVKRAIETALKHLRCQNNAELLISVREGSTESKEYTVYVPGDYQRCDNCWIIRVSRGGWGVLDGPYSVVWIDQKTGKVVKSGGGSGG